MGYCEQDNMFQYGKYNFYYCGRDCHEAVRRHTAIDVFCGAKEK
ncbi:hypothetical protein CFter6_2981 [Collimonas fungivorans]|uniref:Uncharacterized protein n=1 Tax=Collimonas fungivorans TaxID=158899 RepID=A0A127PCV4_9BURK|nr:hypothetical protein CFter6_2981 [Collimonas fungivorans]